ncbi:MAG: PP2C family protein-serine/threonine phosphatase [Lachnospiraceae bacterium]
MEMELAVLPEFGKQRLLYRADSYRNLAKTFLDFPTIKKDSMQDRKSYMFYRQAAENREFMAEQYLDMAEKIAEIAVDSYNYLPTRDKLYRQIAKLLKEEGIIVKHVYFIEDKNKNCVLEITMKSVGNEKMPTRDIAALLGIFYEMRFVPSLQNDYFIEHEFKSFVFVEEPGFCYMSGMSCITKNGEEVSGDNIHQIDGIDGYTYFMIADGVGSGEKASKSSDRILDIMEKFLLAGYSKEVAIQILNGLLLQQGDEQAVSTLDVLEVDLYRGVCEFCKAGAPQSFWKRGDEVEVVGVKSLPLGSIGIVESTTSYKKLTDGDYMIMLSDGMLEYLEDVEREERLMEYIASITLQNPTQIAHAILQRCITLCKGAVLDDMTVLVIGFWRNNSY